MVCLIRFSFAPLSLQVRSTQKAIKHALTERWYAFEDAKILADDDSEVKVGRGKGEGQFSSNNFEV